jgi:hypothetical protein
VAQVERKVTASTGAAAVSGLALWALGTYVFKGAVPDVVVSWTYVIVPAVLTFAAGYLAKHTPRGGPAVLPGIPYAPAWPPKTLIPPDPAPPAGTPQPPAAPE